MKKQIKKVLSLLLTAVLLLSVMSVTAFAAEIPGVTTHPTDQTVAAGQNATFTIVAGGDPTPTYQWQVSTNSGSDWNDVSDGSVYSGATTDTLSLTGVTAAMSGYQYRCVVENTEGDATSNAARLTVQPDVTFTFHSGELNLNKTPTNWVFKTNDFALLASLEFAVIRFEPVPNPDGKGSNHYPTGGNQGIGELANLVYDDTTGELTVPTPLSTHAQTSGHGVLPGGDYKAIITFVDDISSPTVFFDYEVLFTISDSTPTPSPTPSRDSDRDSSSSDRDTTPAPVSTWLERDPAATLAARAKSRGEDYARTRITGIYGVRGNAWDRLTGLRYQHDTTDDGAVQVRIYIDNPEKLTKDTRVSGYVKGPEVDSRKAFFEKWFNNKLRVIHFDHQGAWGQPVEVAAKVDLTGMDTKNLYFYSYDKETNSYKRIVKPAYWIDKNGYLHFTTEMAGDIIISEGPLTPKGQN